jgi:hypothetical protein
MFQGGETALQADCDRFDSDWLHHMIEENEVEEIEMFPEHQFPEFRKADYDQWAAEFKAHLIDLFK